MLDEAPHWSRLLWSPSAMAWYARHRTLFAVRLGTLALGVWFGGLFAWTLILSYGEPFGEPASESLIKTGVAWFVFAGVIHGWTWLVKDTAFQSRGDMVFAGVCLASVPATLFDLPDSLLSIYRDALQFEFPGSAQTSLPPLPRWLHDATLTWMWLFAALLIWINYAARVGKTIRYFTQPDEQRCPACGYDLRGTLAAGIERCPECGAPAFAEEPRRTGHRGSG